MSGVRIPDGSPSRSKVRFAPTYFFVCDRKEGIRLSPWLLLFTKNSRSAHLSGSKRPARRFDATFARSRALGLPSPKGIFFHVAFPKSAGIARCFPILFFEKPALWNPRPPLVFWTQFITAYHKSKFCRTLSCFFTFRNPSIFHTGAERPFRTPEQQKGLDTGKKLARDSNTRLNLNSVSYAFFRPAVCYLRPQVFSVLLETILFAF